MYSFAAVDTEFTGLAAQPSDEPRLVDRVNTRVYDDIIMIVQ